MNFLWVALMVCVGVAGCGKTPVAKETAQVNSGTLTLPQSDALLAGQAGSAGVAAQTALTSGQNAAAGNMVENKEAGPLVESASSVTPASVAASADAVVDSSETPDGAAIQKALKNLGLYSGTIDGKIGPKTKEAIIEFQKKNNLTADGKVGPKTWALLEKAQG